MGKVSRAVVILVSPALEKLIEILLLHRDNFIEKNNEYLFAMPGSRISWGRGDVAIRKLVNKMNLENPSVMTSNKLRKQIATVMQIWSLTKEDTKQFSKFMGHTEKTHNEFYE